MTDNEERTARDVREAIDAYIAGRVDRAPAVSEAWNEFTEKVWQVRAALEPHGLAGLAMDLEELANAVITETIRAAFFQGLAFDARALLLAEQEG